MEDYENYIPIDSHLNDFKQYLDSNSRCILSAKFGDGKSYFINCFIEANNNDYLFIPIYPVNYQVADNKDIFELIKRDILLKLLSSDDVDIDNTEINKFLLLQSYIKDKKCDILFDGLSLIPDINIYGAEIKIGSLLSNSKKLKDKFDTYCEKFNSPEKLSENFINTFDNSKGSIYEFDSTSQLICDIILQCKREHNKKVVLLIEDLDRIDPAHIFRILNVFSAHFDRYNPNIEEFRITYGDNKFCFDKIISVCDLENIKNIYAHVYGEKTDFLGYISKFSNSKEFTYSLKSNIKDYILSTLIDKDLLKYTKICNKFVDCVLNKSYSGYEYNLRTIKKRINKAYLSIREEKIPLDKSLEGKYIKSYSDYTKLLSLLKVFGIRFDQNSSTHYKCDGINGLYFQDDKLKEELIAIVGVNWVLCSFYSDNFCFNLNGATLSVSYEEINGIVKNSKPIDSITGYINGDYLESFQLNPVEYYENIFYLGIQNINTSLLKYII